MNTTLGDWQVTLLCILPLSCSPQSTTATVSPPWQRPVIRYGVPTKPRPYELQPSVCIDCEGVATNSENEVIFTPGQSEPIAPNSLLYLISSGMHRASSIERKRVAFWTCGEAPAHSLFSVIAGLKNETDGPVRFLIAGHPHEDGTVLGIELYYQAETSERLVVLSVGPQGQLSASLETPREELRKLRDVSARLRSNPALFELQVRDGVTIAHVAEFLEDCTTNGRVYLSSP